MISVRLDEKEEAFLNALAAKTNRSKSYYVRKAIQSFLEDQAEHELAAQAYKEFLESGEKTYSWEQVKAENGL